MLSEAKARAVRLLAEVRGAPDPNPYRGASDEAIAADLLLFLAGARNSRDPEAFTG
jgi:hypothetical protein